MSLSGTTLTVTTLTTAGLLTNNTSGQVSTVTGSSLGSLLGGSPTFTGLTLSGLTSTMLKTNSSNGIVAAIANTDYQIPVTGSTNITVNPSTGVISTSTSPTFTSLTLSGISGSMLKTVSGVITGAIAYTDYTPAITAPSGSNLTINTSLNTISVVNPPVFSNIANSTIGTNNVLHGTGSGVGLTTGSANSLYGSSAGAAITTGTNVIAIGYNSGGIITTGSYGTYIGAGATASSTSVIGETVISNSASTVTGKGANTTYIVSPAGLFGGQFTPSVSAGVPTYTTNANGSYTSIINDLLFQWVQWTTVSWSASGTQTVTWTFPVNWPNRAIFVAITMPSSSAGTVNMQYSSLTTSSVSISLYNNFGGAQSGAPIFYAFGY